MGLTHSPRSQPLRKMFVYYALLFTLTPTASLAANPARMSSSWASKRERQHAKQVQESRKSAKVSRQEESGSISPNAATVELYEGEFEALGYPNTLAIYLSAEASKVQGGRGGVFQHKQDEALPTSVETNSWRPVAFLLRLWALDCWERSFRQ